MLICSQSVKYPWFSFMNRVIFQSNVRGERVEEVSALASCVCAVLYDSVCLHGSCV